MTDERSPNTTDRKLGQRVRARRLEIGLVDPGETLELDGLSDAAWRERIGNMVPPPAAAAIAGIMGRTLLLAMTGETFQLSNEPIWVRPVAAALMAARADCSEAA